VGAPLAGFEVRSVGLIGSPFDGTDQKITGNLVRI
jgi:hypothetical protein